jgi:glycosyltransferase involved in cell wall biosynthesis
LFAVLCGELTPYRVHLHRRLASEVPGVHLATVLYRDSAFSAWNLADPPEIGVARLAEGLVARFRGRFGKLRYQLAQARRVRRWLHENSPDVVLVNGYNHLALIEAVGWCRLRGVPVMLAADSNVRADVATGLKRVIKRVFVRFIVRQMAAVLPFGTLGRDYFLRYGAKLDRIFLCPYEPDYQQIAGLSDVQIEAIRRRFDLDPERWRFVVSSRLVTHKRVDIAIDAFAQIASQRPEWDLVIMGDGPEIKRLQRRVPAELQRRVKFTGFLGNQSEVSSMYRACHVLVHPAEYEPWALVINEAAAAELAIICSDVVGAAAELVRDGVNGRLVPAGNVAAFMEAMLLCSAPGRVQELRQGSATVLNEWRQRADPVEGVRGALKRAGVTI